MKEFYYQAYGLTVRSDIALPEFSPAGFSFNPDVVFERMAIGFIPEKGDGVTYRVQAPDEVRVQWSEAGAAKVTGGHLVQYEQCSGTHGVTFRLFLICQVFGVLLQQRGVLVLHASAIEYDGVVTAFAGPHGRGKSTLATAACASGARLISDDVLAVGFDSDGGSVAWPAFGWMRLSTGVAQLLPDSETRLGIPIPNTGKSLYDLRDRFQPQPKPLAAIYYPEDGATIRRDPWQHREAFGRLCWQTYGRALIPFLDLAGVHLQQCSQLIRMGLVQRLERPRTLEALPQVLELIWQHSATFA